MIMKTTIAQLVAQMQKVIEVQNNSLSGGYLSVGKGLSELYGTDEFNNDKCIEAKSTNKGCTNLLDCTKSLNYGSCKNVKICYDTDDRNKCGKIVTSSNNIM